MAAVAFSAAPADGRTILGHPAGLFMLFFAEMWERFSYYGMRALLIFYLTKHFLFGDDRAYLLYGAYTSLVYITPVIGGFVADRFLGARKAVLLGGVFIAIGHLMIALTDGPVGDHGARLEGFYLGLAAIIVGTGFLKANIAVLVGALYPPADPRRDPAFSIFYMGINLGGFLGPIACGLLGEGIGWSYGFGAAAVGMLLGLVVFVIYRPLLHGHGEPLDAVALKRRTSIGVSREWAIYAGAAAGIAVVWLLIRSPGTVGVLLLAFAAVTVGFILWRCFTTLARVDRHRIFAALFLMALNPLFWGLFEQAGSSLSIFTDRRVDRNLLGWDVPASLFQSVNSIFIILLAPMFAILWTWLERRRREPSAPAKFGIGLLLAGAGFLVLVAGAAASGSALTPVVFIFLVYLLHTMAELCFSPVGLAAMTRLSLPSMVGLVMGTWYLAMAGGEFAAGLIARATGGADAGPDRVLEVYSKIGWISIAVGVAVIAVSPLVKRLMHLGTIGRDGHPLAGQGAIGEPAATGMHSEKEQRV